MKNPIEIQSPAGAFDRSVDSASDSIHNVIDKASHAAAPAIESMANGAHHAVNKMADGAHHAADAVVHKGEQLHDLQQRLTVSTREHVRKHPFITLGLAVAGGALLGLWLNKKRDVS